MTTRRSLVQCSAGLLAGIDLAPIPDLQLAHLWSRFVRAEARLESAWALAAERSDDCAFSELSDAADAMGHEHDRIVQQIAAQPASSWQGVTIKLLTWRRTANLSEFNLPDADAALAFSVYLDALRLCPGALGAANDVAIARLALRHPDQAGE